MPDLDDVVVIAVRALRDVGAEFAIVGGLAVAMRTEPRFTKDVDVAVAVDSDLAAEQLVRSIQGAGFTTLAALEHADVDRLATVRLKLRRSADAPIVDMLFASCGIESEIVRGAEMLGIFPDLRAPVASTGHLIAMKLLSRDDERRPLDRSDLIWLRDIATPEDWITAEEGVRLIAARGFHRSRDLVRLLEELRNEGYTTDESQHFRER